MIQANQVVSWFKDLEIIERKGLNVPADYAQTILQIIGEAGKDNTGEGNMPLEQWFKAFTHTDAEGLVFPTVKNYRV